MCSKKIVSVFGSTGSVGQSTVDLLKANPDKFQVKVLTAHKNADLLIAQAQVLKPETVVIGDEGYQAVKTALPSVKVLSGSEALVEAAAQRTDLVVAALMGIAGIKPILDCLPHTKTLAIANKEPLVAAGQLVLEAAQKYDVKILPLDSEHNAIFQVFEERNRASIDKLILTASGGPFLNWTQEQLDNVMPEQALKHPNWSMGAKISIDSATMMNKALELIEAHYLFKMPAYKIEVLIHPQSIVHSMVSYQDGSVLAQLGAPDMRTPIAYALAWPERMNTTGQKLDFSQVQKLEFQQPDFEKMPALKMAYDCLKSGQASQIVFNAANEIAVAAFLDKKIGFNDILRLVDKAGQSGYSDKLSSLGDILALDKTVRDLTKSYI